MKNSILVLVFFLFSCVVLFGEVGEVVVIQPEQIDSPIVMVETEGDQNYQYDSDYSENKLFSPVPFNSENDLTKAVYDANSFIFGVNSDLLIQQNLMTLQSLQQLYNTLEGTSTIVLTDYKNGIESVIDGEVNLSLLENTNLFLGLGFDRLVVGAFADLYIDASIDLPPWPFEVILSGNEIGKQYEPFSATDTVLDSSLSVGGFLGYKADSFTVNLSVGMYGPVLYSDMHRTFEFESSNTAAATAIVSGTVYSGFDPKTIEFKDVEDIIKSGGWKIDAGFVYGNDYPIFGIDVKNIAITEAKFSKSGQFDAEAFFNFDTSATPPATYSADYTKEIQWVNATGTSYKLKPTISGYFNIPINEMLWGQVHAQNKPVSGFNFGGGITAFISDNFSLLLDYTRSAKGFNYLTTGFGFQMENGRLDINAGVGMKDFDFKSFTSPKIGITSVINF